jgi:hypothetical protein
MTTMDKWENARSPKVNIEGRMIEIDDEITQNIPHRSTMVCLTYLINLLLL